LFNRIVCNALNPKPFQLLCFVSIIGMSLLKLLENTKLSDLNVLNLQSLIAVETTDSVFSAFKKLFSNRISAAPVYNSAAQQWVGILEMEDIVRYTLGLHKNSSSAPSMSFSDSVEKILRHESFITIAEDASLAFAVRSFCENGARVMAVTITPSSTENSVRVISLLSHSVLIQFLMEIKDQQFQGPEELNSIQSSLFNTSISSKLADLPCQTQLITVRGDDNLYNAFQLLCDYHISACPIVDQHGQIIGNISYSDLQEDFLENPSSLDQLVSDYLNGNPLRRLPVTCDPESSLLSIMEKLIVAEIHRIYITEGLDRPIGVVSTTDILKIVFKMLAYENS
jgi:predicted transcriptional regulator